MLFLNQKEQENNSFVLDGDLLQLIDDSTARRTLL